MNTKRLFVVFSLIGWSIALAAIYQWSQPAFTPSIQPQVKSLPAEPGQAEQPTHYLPPPDNYYHAEQPRTYPTPLYQRQQPQVLEM